MTELLVPKRKPAFTVKGKHPGELFGKSGRFFKLVVELNQKVVYENKLNGVVVELPKGTQWTIHGYADKNSVRLQYVNDCYYGCLSVYGAYPFAVSPSEWSTLTWTVVNRVLEAASLYETWNGGVFPTPKKAESKLRESVKVVYHKHATGTQTAYQGLSKLNTGAKRV